MQIFLLTDGQVDNRDECIATVADNAATTRVYAFGIGRATDTLLVKGLAEAGGGSGVVLDDNSNVNKTVLGQLRRALKVTSDFF